jgi:DNA-binding CsgD family transcriptional regulator
MSIPERRPTATPGRNGTAAPSSRLSLRDLDRLLAGIGEGGFAVGAEGRILLWNAAAERILGHAARDVIGRRCDQVFGTPGAGQGGPCPSCGVLCAPGTGKPGQAFEMEGITRTGRRIWLGVSVVAASACGNVTVHLFHDATHRRDLAHIVQDGAVPSAGGNGAGRTLSPRELEVLQLLVAGAGTRTAAERLHVSLATVRNHVQSILRKLEVHSRLEAVAYANRHRLI